MNWRKFLCEILRRVVTLKKCINYNTPLDTAIKPFTKEHAFSLADRCVRVYCLIRYVMKILSDRFSVHWKRAYVLAIRFETWTVGVKSKECIQNFCICVFGEGGNDSPARPYCQATIQSPKLSEFGWFTANKRGACTYYKIDSLHLEPQKLWERLFISLPLWIASWNLFFFFTWSCFCDTSDFACLLIFFFFGRSIDSISPISGLGGQYSNSINCTVTTCLRIKNRFSLVAGAQAKLRSMFSYLRQENIVQGNFHWCHSSPSWPAN